MAGAVYPSGAFYRADLVTEFVPGASDLARTLFEEDHPEAERAEVLSCIGVLVARTAAAGILHRDLNAKNLLIDWSTGGPAPLLVDLDRCEVKPPDRTVDPRGMLERLERSLRKHEERSSRGLGRAEWATLHRSAGLRTYA